MSIDAPDIVHKLRWSKQKIDAQEPARVEAALNLLYPLREEVAAELATFDNRYLTSYELSRRADRRETLKQIDEGFHHEEGTDPRLYELVSRPEIARFRFKRPGIAPLKRLQARLREEQEIVDE